MKPAESTAFATVRVESRAHPTHDGSVPRQCVLDASGTGAWERVGGISPIARMLYHLDRLGIEEVVVLLSSDRGLKGLETWTGGLRLREARKDAQLSLAGNLLSMARIDRRFLYLDAAHLVDPRLIKALAAASETTLAFMDPRDARNGTVRAGLLHVDDLPAWAEEGDAALARRSKPLFPSSIDPYSPEIRGPLTPYFLEVRSREDALEATRLLIRSQQKHVMDLPAEFIDPPFENALTFWLCRTSISPDMVTLIGGAVAFFVAWLFWHGHFVAGALLTFVVEILDGVDGKLARTKLQFSRFGRHEDIFDYFCENSWYVALGVGLSASTPGNWPFFAAALLIFSDTVDNVLYALAGKWHGKSIDLYRPFDAAFRRIAGRRNIYGFMFIVGFVAGFPLQTFILAAAWAAVTAAIHLVRLIQFGRAVARGCG
ncbi:MAG TPA: CDP-alcohol phosphatidyltransferase family protein [Syntrophobacter fumaroxidans]|mgnify:CR=1 FL=1|nr:CDP-alcohol phosphatidyltransferase family protein [Syntrophobacter fumaroxidans]